MPDMHLKQLGITYSACRPITKNKERIQKFKEARNTNYITKMNLIKPAFNRIWLMEILKI